MTTRHIIIATLIIAAGLAWSGTASAGSLQKRLENQHYRIRDGIADGELTYREARRLRHHHRVVRQMRHHFLADGHLSHRERKILNYRLDRNSYRIKALKHNHRYYEGRGWYKYYGGRGWHRHYR